MTIGSFSNALYFWRSKDINEFLDIAGIPKAGLGLSGVDYLASRLNSFYNEFIRLQREEKIRKELSDKIKNLKVGDRVTVVPGFGSHGKGYSASFAGCEGIEYEVKSFDRFGQKLDIKHVDDSGSVSWTIFPSMIASVRDAPLIKKRSCIDRRGQKAYGRGADLDIVEALENRNKTIKLDQEQKDVLYSAIQRLRADGSGNGFRSGNERRKF